MAEELKIVHGGKDERYDLLHRQVVALVEGESDEIANMATATKNRRAIFISF